MKQPAPWLWIPRLAGGGEFAQARNVVAAHRFFPMFDERTDQGWRDAQCGDAMALDQIPQAIRSGVVQCAIIEQHRRAQKQNTEYKPRPHHPTHISDPKECFVGMQIEALFYVLGRLDGKAAM